MGRNEILAIQLLCAHRLQQLVIALPQCFMLPVSVDLFLQCLLLKGQGTLRCLPQLIHLRGNDYRVKQSKAKSRKMD